jgi:hypothetical protein
MARLNKTQRRSLVVLLDRDGALPAPYPTIQSLLKLRLITKLPPQYAWGPLRYTLTDEGRKEAEKWKLVYTADSTRR